MHLLSWRSADYLATCDGVSKERCVHRKVAAAILARHAPVAGSSMSALSLESAAAAAPLLTSLARPVSFPLEIRGDGPGRGGFRHGDTMGFIGKHTGDIHLCRCTCVPTVFSRPCSLARLLCYRSQLRFVVLLLESFCCVRLSSVVPVFASAGLVLPMSCRRCCAVCRPWEIVHRACQPCVLRCPCHTCPCIVPVCCPAS